MVFCRMVGDGNMPLSAAEPKNMIDVDFVQDSDSNKDSMSAICAQFLFAVNTVLMYTSCE